MTAQTVNCATHGKAFETFVCRHLIDGESKQWHSKAPSDDNRWPSAWCEQCHTFYLAHGGWDEEAEKQADLLSNVSLLCNHCYEHLRSQCVQVTV